MIDTTNVPPIANAGWQRAAAPASNGSSTKAQGGRKLQDKDRAADGVQSNQRQNQLPPHPRLALLCWSLAPRLAADPIRSGATTRTPMPIGKEGPGDTPKPSK